MNYIHSNWYLYRLQYIIYNTIHCYCFMCTSSGNSRKSLFNLFYTLLIEHYEFKIKFQFSIVTKIFLDLKPKHISNILEKSCTVVFCWYRHASKQTNTYVYVGTYILELKWLVCVSPTGCLMSISLGTERTLFESKNNIACI